MKSTFFALSGLLVGSIAAPLGKEDLGLDYPTSSYSYSFPVPTKPSYASPSFPTNTHTVGDWLESPENPYHAPNLPSPTYSSPSSFPAATETPYTPPYFPGHEHPTGPSSFPAATGNPWQAPHISAHTQTYTSTTWSSLPISTGAPYAAPFPTGGEEQQQPTKEDIIAKFEELQKTIHEHASKMNETAKNYPGPNGPNGPNGHKKPAFALLIEAELKAIFTAIEELIAFLFELKVVLIFTLEEIHLLATLIFQIIFEIVFTVLFVLKALDIKTIIFGLLAELALLIVKLIVVVEGLAGGVLVIVYGLISAQPFYGHMQGVFGGLAAALAQAHGYPAVGA